MKLYRKYLKYLFIGISGGLAYPPTYCVFFIPFMFYFILKNISMNWKMATILSFGYFMTQYYWIPFSMLVDINTYWWVFPFALLGVGLTGSIFLTLPILLSNRVIIKLKLKNKFLISLIFSLLYVFFEYLRGFILTWNFISYTLAFSTLLIQVANFLNIYVFDFIVVSFCCFLYVLLPQSTNNNWFSKFNRD